MSSQNPPPADSAAVSGKGLGVVPLLFTSPSEAFRRLGADPQWIGPFVLFLVLACVSTAVRMPQDLAFQYEAAESVMERLGLPDADIDEALAAMPDPEEMGGGALALHVGQAGGALAVFGFLGALVLWVIARLFGPQPTFRRALCVYWTANLAAALGYLLLAVVVRMTDSIEISLGLAALVPGLEWGSLSYLLLDVVNVFSLLTVFLLAIGARFVFATSKGTGWAIGGTFWVLTTVVALAFQIFGSWASGRL